MKQRGGTCRQLDRVGYNAAGDENGDVRSHISIKCKYESQTPTMNNLPTAVVIVANFERSTFHSIHASRSSSGSHRQQQR